MKKVSIQEIEEALTPQTVRTFQIIHLSIMSGVSFFLVIVLYMFFSRAEAGAIADGDLEFIKVMTLVHAVLFAVGYLASQYVYKRFLSQERIESIAGKGAEGGSGTAELYIGIVRSAKILAIALMEAPVFFGLIVCYLGVMNSVLDRHSIYWINLLSYPAFMYLMSGDFPTREKLLAIFKNEMRYLAA